MCRREPAHPKNTATATAKSNSGCYILKFLIKKRLRLRAGRLGELELGPGCCFYVGRAKSGLAQRVARHVRGGALRWHVDYLRREAPVAAVLTTELLEECGLAAALGSLPGARVVPRFGASDCRCAGHLVCFAREPQLDEGFLKRWGLQEYGRGIGRSDTLR